MRIGIDLTALPRQPVGAGNYMLYLVRALAELDTGAHYVLFAPPHVRKLMGELPEPHWSWAMVPERGILQRLVWEQAGLPRLVKRLGVELLHSPHYTMPLSHPCRSVVTYHDMTFFLFPRLHTLPKRFFFPLMIRATARRADALLADSESTRRDAIRLLGIPPEKIVTTPLGVTGNFRVIHDQALLDQIRAKYELPAQFILYVGLVEPRKNLPLLVTAYRQLVDLGVRHTLVVAGGFGWGVEDVFRRIDQLQLREQIKFIGHVPHSDLPMVYNLADVFVYPSNYEGFGLPPLEAMACGTPVIAFRRGALPEIVEDGKTGFVVDTVGQMVEAIKKIDTIDRSAVRRSVEQRFSLERMLDDYEAAYLDLAAKG
jgi:glycosyltransferase involved in cell wall biosynthesis